MSGFILRIIAMSTMLIDHIGWNFIDNPMLLTWIGRIAFPCYAFLLAEGFFFIFKDQKRFLKHLSTLIFLAVVSEPCYDLFKFGADVTTRFMEFQSVIITLLLGFLGMSITELLIPSKRDNNEKIGWKNIIILVCAYLLIGFANYAMKASYTFMGPLLVIAFYWYIRFSRNKEKTGNKRCWVKRFWVLIGIFAVYLSIYFRFRCGFGDTTTRIAYTRHYMPWVFGHGLAAFILSFSNGKLGYHKKRFKIFYTLFYPVHILIIGLIITL